MKTKNIKIRLGITINKIRELESLSEDLRKKLDATLEENIILHSEHDEYKLEMDEKIQRLIEELEENKNEILSKIKEIYQIKNHRDFLLKTAYNQNDDIENNLLDKDSIKNVQRKSLSIMFAIENFTLVFNSTQNNSKQINLEKNKIIENIDDALSKIKQRKEKIMLQKNLITSFQNKILKQNYKISIK